MRKQLEHLEQPNRLRVMLKKRVPLVGLHFHIDIDIDIFTLAFFLR